MPREDEVIICRDRGKATVDGGINGILEPAERERLASELHQRQMQAEIHEPIVADSLPRTRRGQSIEILSVLEGSLPPRVERLLRDLAREHRAAPLTDLRRVRALKRESG